MSAAALQIDGPPRTCSVSLTPPACPQYFGDCLSLEDLDEVNIEIIRNTLYKAYIEDFYSFCQKVGGTTGEVMGDILQLEADRRAINITINSIDTDLDIKQREKLYPTIGLLYPEGTSRLAKATDIDAVRSAIDAFPVRLGPESSRIAQRQRRGQRYINGIATIDG